MPIQLFSSVKDAKENIEKIESNNVGYVENNTKTSYIDKGNLIIHTSNYGYITIPAGDWSFGGVMDGKPETGAFGTVSVESITMPITASLKYQLKWVTVAFWLSEIVIDFMIRYTYTITTKN